MAATKRHGKNAAVRWAGAAVGAVVLAFLVCANIYVHKPHSDRDRLGGAMPAWVASHLEYWGNVSANITDALGITGFDAVTHYAGRLEGNSFKGVGLPAGKSGEVQIVRRKGHTVAYAPALRHPLWVAYAATPYGVPAADPDRRPGSFKVDREVANSPRSSDYKGSGYDRGHMAPNMAIAVRHGEKAQAQTFLLSNICPQRPGLNRGPWFEMEYRISEEWPDVYSTVWTVAGAIPSKDRRLKNGIDVPKAFYQVALSCDRNGRLRVLAVYMPQHVRRRDFARSYLISVDELEKRTGLRFFPDLPSAVRAQLWKQEPNRLWPTGIFSVFRILRRRYY